MLENIREKSQGTVAKVILGFIILTFAIAGIGSYTNSTDTSVAEVNGEPISQRDFEQAYQQQRSRMAQQYGQMFEQISANPEFAAQIRNNVLENLINEKLLNQTANELGIRVSDEYLKKAIRETPQFQRDGKFDNNTYIALIRQAGFYQASSYRDYLRIELARRQLSQSIVATEFSVPYQVELLATLREQKRDLRFATIALEQFKSSVEVTDEEIKNHYQANLSLYQNEEKVKVDYVLLDMNNISESIDVSEAEALAFYEDNINRYTEAEKRRIAHILIEPADDAQTQANQLFDKLNAGEDFATLAKDNSADFVSAENGGDLEWFEAGVYGDAFDNAVLSLDNVGEISNVIETDAGLHIIKLTDLETEKVMAFDEIKETVTKTIAKEEARNQFAELQAELARVSYEIADSLEEAATAINTEVKTSDWLSRSQNINPFDAPQVLEALFSNIVLEEKLNSDVIELSDEQAIVVRLNEYQAAEVKPLDEVSALIKSQLTTDKAKIEAKNTADALLASLVANEDISTALNDLGSDFELKEGVKRYGSGVDASIVRKAFALAHPSEAQVSATTLTLSNGDIALVEVEKVIEGEKENKVVEGLTQQFNAQEAQSFFANYVASLAEDAKIIRKQIVVEESNN